MIDKKDAIRILNLIPFFKNISYAELRMEVTKKFPELVEKFDEIINVLMTEGFIFEPSPGYVSRLVEEKPEPKKEDAKKEESKKEQEKEEKEASVGKESEHDYFPLGEGKGISLWVLDNGIRLQRRIREGNTWKTEQEIFLSRPILEKLYIRLPYYFQKIKKEDEK